MGLTIFYSLSAPANVPEEDVLNRLNLLRTKAEALVKKSFPKGKVGKVGKLYSLSHDELVVAQADPHCEVFPFARQSCRPIGARDCVPEAGFGFGIELAPNWEVWMGLCRYPAGSPIMIEWAGNEDANYDGQWFYYNYVDPMGTEPRLFLRSLLKAAKANGFVVQVRDEARDAFEELKL